MKRTDAAPRYLTFAGIAVGGCAADLATKSWIFSRLGMPQQGGRIEWIVDGLFGFQTSLNQGALFGIGQGLVWLFALLSIVAATGILAWLIFTRAAGGWGQLVALACIMAGILGNLYDRLGLPGLTTRDGERIFAVRDWILFKYQDWHWPNFNFADSLLVCGAFLLAWQMVRSPDGPKPPT